MSTPAVRHLLADDDLTAAEQTALLDDAQARRDARAAGHRPDADAPLAGRSVALVFEKPSTRTRISFDVAVAELGGHPVPVDAATSQLGRGETIEDTARVLSRYVDAIVVRTGAHARLEALAAASAVPVVNALTDDLHPCQLLADLLTLRQRFGTLPGLTVAWTGDGASNVASSWLLAGALAGLHLRVGAPAAHAPSPALLARARAVGGSSGATVTVTEDPAEAAAGADALVTDVFTSMGQEVEAAARAAALAPYALTTALLDQAAPHAVVLHCLPAHRGEEVEAAVLDGPRALVWDEAENRLHAQKALLAWLVP